MAENSVTAPKYLHARPNYNTFTAFIHYSKIGMRELS